MLCQEILKPTPSFKYQKYVPDGGWDRYIAHFAAIFIDLNDKRMLADYDPTYVVVAAEVEASVALARIAIGAFDAAGEALRQAFLTLVLFPPR